MAVKNIRLKESNAEYDKYKKWTLRYVNECIKWLEEIKDNTDSITKTDDMLETMRIMRDVFISVGDSAETISKIANRQNNY